MTSGKYAVYTIVTTIITAAILVGIIFVLLPELGIHLPFWAIAITMVAFVAYNIAIYLLCKKTMANNLHPINQITVGSRGRTISPLCPEGTISIKGELWKARSNYYIGRGEIVMVEGIKGLILHVTHHSKRLEVTSNKNRPAKTDKLY